MKRVLFLILLLTAALSSSALDYERFEQGGKVGIRDTQGQVVLPAAFDALGWSDGSFSLIGQITGYRQGSRWGLINLKKEYVTKADYLTITSAGGDRVRVSRELNAVATRYGCLNLSGEVVIPFEYDDITIHDLRAVVMRKEGARYNYGLIDLNNRTVLPLQYERITPLGTLRYAVRNFEGKTALYADDGKWITGFDIDSLSSFRHDLAVVYKNLRRGVIDRTGTVRAEAVYHDIEISVDGPVRARRPSVWMIMDLHQKELHSLEADALHPLAPNRNRVTLQQQNGLVDSLFREILPLEYNFVGPVIHDKLVVGKQNKFGLVRTNRSVVLPLEFDSLLLEGHLVRARETTGGKSSWSLYDTVGVRKTQNSYDRLDPYNGQYFPVVRSGFAGAVDRTGRERIACVYDSLLGFDESRSVVKFKGLYGIISLEDVWLIMPQPNRLSLLPDNLYLERQDNLKLVKDSAGQIIYFTDNPLTVDQDHFLEKLPDGTEKEINFRGQLIVRRPPALVREIATARESEGLTQVYRDGKYGFVDSRGRLRIANRYEAAGDFHEGLAPVRLIGKWGYIDKGDQVVIHPIYDGPSEFRDGMAIVQRNGRSGIIHRDGSTALELRYDSIRRLDNKTFLLASNNHYGLADAQGRILLEPRFESLTLAGDHHVIVSQNGRFGLLTRDGLSVFPLRYEHLEYSPISQTFFARQSFDWETLDLK